MTVACCMYRIPLELCLDDRFKYVFAWALVQLSWSQARSLRQPESRCPLPCEPLVGVLA